MVGINIQFRFRWRAFHSFGGWKALGVCGLTSMGPDGVRYTRMKPLPRVGRADSESYRSSVCRLSVMRFQEGRRLWPLADACTSELKYPSTFPLKMQAGSMSVLMSGS